MASHKLINKDFFKKWSPNMAYILGFFAADGYMTVNRRNGQFWCIQITDGELLQEIKIALGSEHKISLRKRTGNSSDIYRIQIGSIEMCNDLRKLGYCERKTMSLSIPYVPDRYFCHFVRGYFDGDGNVWTGLMHKGRNVITQVIAVVFTSCSEGFLRQLQSRLTFDGMPGGCIYQTKKKALRLQYSIRNSLKLYNFMYNRLGTSKLFLQRKKDVFEKYKQIVNVAVV